MTETQSIIIYRNPLEKAIWEGDVNVLPIMAWMVVTVIMVVLVHSAINAHWFRAHITNKIQNNSITSYTTVALSALFGVYVGSLFIV